VSGDVHARFCESREVRLLPATHPLRVAGAARHGQRGADWRRADSVTDQTIAELALVIGTRAACAAVGRSRATYYRYHRQSPSSPRPSRKRVPQPRALSQSERAEVLGVLHQERFVDQAPASVYANLLDEGRYLCSVPTMYRLLRSEDEVRERRRQATHPATVKPELVATGPNQVWSWDITKLLGSQKWTYFHLYVIIDIFSRYIVGWLLAPRETAELAERLLAETIRKQNVAIDQLTIHADRGTSMASKPVALLLADLGVTKSHSRPHCSNDNPYSEAHFKTLKYRPEFPGRFGSIEDGRAFCQRFFRWYNYQHRHSGLGFHTPAAVHFNHAEGIQVERARVLQAAYAAHPERFVRQAPVPPPLPQPAWINRPVEVSPAQ
jgi:putative transposase